MKQWMIEPFPVFINLSVQPSRKPSQLINKLPIKVPYTTFHLALVLWVIRMCKVRFNTIPLAPFLPFLPELWAIVRQYVLRFPVQFFKQPCYLFGCRLMAELPCQYKKSAAVVYAHNKPVLLPVHCVRPLQVYLPQLARFLGSASTSSACSYADNRLYHAW